MEQVQVSVHGSLVTFLCKDGLHSTVPREVADRSSLLRTTLSETAVGETFALAMPTGVLQKWLQCVGEEPYVLQLLQVRSLLTLPKSARLQEILCTRPTN